MRPHLEIGERLRASLFERARWLTRKRELQRLTAELRLPGTFQRDLETLRSIASIKAHLCEPVRTIIDIGAHVGAFAEPAAIALGAEEVVCIEPQVPLHERLCSRLAGLKHRVLDCALGGTLGEGTFFVHADASMSSLLTANTDVLRTQFDTYDHTRIGTTLVRVSTLDHQLADLDLSAPFLIKLDTQGTELQILRGAKQTLQRTAAVLVEHMFTTPYQDATQFSDLVSFMTDHGFACAAVTGLVRRPSHRISAVDFLFIASGHNSATRHN